jgi:hypothetical protein
VENLKEFHTILYGHSIIIYTDHKNLTFDHFTTDRVKRWRLIVVEYYTDPRSVTSRVNIMSSPILFPDCQSNNLFILPKTFIISLPSIPKIFHLHIQLSVATLNRMILNCPSHADQYETRILQEHPITFYHMMIVVTPAELCDPSLL